MVAITDDFLLCELDVSLFYRHPEDDVKDNLSAAQSDTGAAMAFGAGSGVQWLSC